MITYKFPLTVSKIQATKLWLHANALNRLYNYFLSQRIDLYKSEGLNVSWYQQSAELVDLKDTEEWKILREINAQVIRESPKRLDITYKNFFRRKFGFPKFRACRNFFGITYPQSGYKIINNNLFTTKIYGEMYFEKHREIKGKIKTVTITCDCRNKWFICIVTDYEIEKSSTGKSAGIDIGVTNIAATSLGEIIPNVRHAKYFDKQIDKLKSKRDKNCKKDSRKFKRMSKIISRLYDVKKRKIDDFLHKTSRSLVNKYDTIFIEDLTVKKMSEGLSTEHNKNMRNAKLGTFILMLKYKARKIVEVNPYNTTKTCNKCGNIQDMKLSERIYICKSCTNTEDRDVNAAKNIFCLGQAILER